MVPVERAQLWKWLGLQYHSLKRIPIIKLFCRCRRKTSLQEMVPFERAQHWKWLGLLFSYNMDRVLRALLHTLPLLPQCFPFPAYAILANNGKLSRSPMPNRRLCCTSQGRRDSYKSWTGRCHRSGYDRRPRIQDLQSSLESSTDCSSRHTKRRRCRATKWMEFPKTTSPASFGKCTSQSICWNHNGLPGCERLHGLMESREPARRLENSRSRPWRR